MKTILNYVLCVLAILVLTRCRKQIIAGQSIKPATSKTGSDSLTSYPSYNTSPLPPDQTGVTSTAAQIASRITLGYNIGNTMEAINNEQGWGAPMITQALIDKLKQIGFNAVRIPCQWDWSHITNKTTEQIDPAWLSRVQQVVQYCVNDGMY
ncbi:MAG: cellulase family glycosylhydrolase, partial [Mucilaginibacter sp.]